MLNFNVVLFLTLNIALITILCSDNIINPFLVVKFRSIRVFGGYFGFPGKFWVAFDNFVGLLKILDKINIFSEKILSILSFI